MDFGMSPGHIQDRYILGSRFSSVQFSTVNSAQQLYLFLDYLWCHFQTGSATKDSTTKDQNVLFIIYVVEYLFT